MDGKEAVVEVTSTQKSLSSGHEPGWNDPPKWAFMPTQGEAAVKTPTKRLNRRVAFPLSSTASQISNVEQPMADLPGNVPPLPSQLSCLTSAPHAPLLAPSARTECDKPSELGIDKDRVLCETLDNFEAVMTNDLVSNGKSEEVRRKLDAMKAMWREDKLRDAVCKSIFEISKALRNGDVEGADKIHVSLIMDHSAVCSTWISGVRHMILALREKSSQISSVSTNEGFHPYLLPEPVEANKNT